MGPFHEVQSFRNRLLQRGSPTGSQALPANLLQHGLLFPQVLPGACSSTGSPQGHSLVRAAPCSSMGSSPGCRWGSALAWTFMGCRDTACLTMVYSTGYRGISASVPEAPPAPPSALTLGSAELLLSFSVLSPAAIAQFVFYPFLTMLCQRCYHHH